jgi:hypothetical protein
MFFLSRKTRLIYQLRINLLFIYMILSRLIIYMKPYWRKPAVGFLPRIAKQLPPMPQLPTEYSFGVYHYYYRRNISVGIWQSSETFTVMPSSSTDSPSVITVENADGLIPSVMFSRKYIFLPRVAVCKTVGGWFFYFRHNQRRNEKLPTISIPTDGFLRWDRR